MLDELKEKKDEFFNDLVDHEKSGPDKAKIKIISSGANKNIGENETVDYETIFMVQLNPNSISISDGVTYNAGAPESKDGRKIPYGQYIQHNTRVLTAKLTFDTYTSRKKESDKDDVKTKYIDKFTKLITNNDNGHPPLVFFSWGSIQFEGVVTNMNCEYTMFTSTGIPVRAKLDLAITQYYFE